MDTEGDGHDGDGEANGYDHDVGAEQNGSQPYSYYNGAWSMHTQCVFMAMLKLLVFSVWAHPARWSGKCCGLSLKMHMNMTPDAGEGGEGEGDGGEGYQGLNGATAAGAEHFDDDDDFGELYSDTPQMLGSEQPAADPVAMDDGDEEVEVEVMAAHDGDANGDVAEGEAHIPVAT